MTTRRPLFVIISYLLCILHCVSSFRLPSVRGFLTGFSSRRRAQASESLASTEAIEDIKTHFRNVTFHFGDPTGQKKKLDAWRYSRTESMLTFPDALPEKTHSEQPLDIPRFHGSTAQLVVVDGVFREDLSSCGDLLKHDIAVRSFGRHDPLPEDLRQIVSELPEARDLPVRDKNDIIGSEFLAWHHLRALDQLIFIETTAGMAFNGSLELVHFFTRNGSQENMVGSTRVVIRVRDNSSLSLVQHLGGFVDGTNGSDRFLTMGHTTILLGRDAKMIHAYSQDLPQSFQGFEIINSTLQENAQYNFSSVMIGANLYRLNAHVHINGPMAQTKLHGLTLCAGRQRNLDFRCDVSHNEPSTFSDQNYRVVLGNGGAAVYKAAIYLPPVAQKSVAAQVCKALLMSQPCSLNAIPVLKVGTEDVDCKHGVAIGDLSEEALMYLATRGLSPNFAKSLLIKSFVEDMVPPSIKVDDSYRQRITATITKLTSMLS